MPAKKRAILALLPLLTVAVILLIYYYAPSWQRAPSTQNQNNAPLLLVTTDQIAAWKKLPPIIAWSNAEPKVAIRFDSENIPLHGIYIYDLKNKKIISWGLMTDDAKDVEWPQIVGHFVDEAITIDEANARLNQMGITDTADGKVGASYLYKNVSYTVEGPNNFHVNSVRFYLPALVGGKKQAVTLYLAKKDTSFNVLNAGETTIYASPDGLYLMAIARGLYPEFGLRQMVWYDSASNIFSQKPFLVK